MSSAEDSAFADMALEMGLVSRKEIEICREALRAADGNGGKFRLSGILRERKYLAKKQVLEVYRALHQQGLYPRIGNYEIMAKLGQGAMGRVYQARQADTSRVVALKVLPRRLSRDTRFLQRFQREAQAMSKLDHPNIVQALDVGEADGYQFFAMEYIEGRTVKELMNRHGPIEEEQALPIAIQVAKALKHANDFGIVHRDVKPSNIMITRDGTAKLCDLGLAKETSEEDDSQLTMSGTAVGTAYYIAPEQARGVADVDIRSDIYSLGATLYHMVVGEVPFEGSSPAVVMTKHVTEDLPPAKERNLALSDHVCNIVEKMMAKDRERRYQTPEELTEDLELALEGRPPGASLTAYMATDSTAEAQAVVDVPGPSERPADPAAVKLGGRYVLVATVIVVAMALAAWSVAFSLKHTRQVADQMRQDHAKRLYLLAEQFASENPDDVLSAISRFDMVAQAARNTDYAHEAMQRGATLRKRLDATAAPLFLRLKTEGDELAKAQQFAKALSVWDRFPGAYAVGDWLDKIAVEKEAYRDLAKRQYANLEADAKALLESGSFTAATETYKTAELFSTPEIAAQAAAQIRQIEAKQRESHAQRVFQDAVQAYEKGQHHAAKRLVEQLAALYPQFDLTSAESGPEGQALSLAQLRGLLADVSSIIVVKQDGTGHYTTLKDALIAARPGDTVEIRDGGVYREPGIGCAAAPSRLDPVIVDKRGLTLRGAGRRPTIVSSAPSSGDYMVGCGPDWTVANIEFMFGNGLYAARGPIAVSNCRFRAPNSVCIGLAGEFGSATIEDCLFRDASAVVQIRESSCESPRIVFRHCVTSDVDSAFSRVGACAGLRVTVTNSIWVNIRRSLILDAFGYEAGQWHTDGNCYWTVGAFYGGGSADSRLTISAFEEWQARNATDRLSIAAEPRFDGSAPNAFRLSIDSPCRQSGVDSADMGIRTPAEIGASEDQGQRGKATGGTPQ